MWDENGNWIPNFVDQDQSLRQNNTNSGPTGYTGPKNFESNWNRSFVNTNNINTQGPQKSNINTQGPPKDDTGKKVMDVIGGGGGGGGGGGMGGGGMGGMNISTMSKGTNALQHMMWQGGHGYDERVGQTKIDDSWGSIADSIWGQTALTDATAGAPWQVQIIANSIDKMIGGFSHAEKKKKYFGAVAKANIYDARDKRLGLREPDYTGQTQGHGGQEYQYNSQFGGMGGGTGTARFGMQVTGEETKKEKLVPGVMEKDEIVIRKNPDGEWAHVLTTGSGAASHEDKGETHLFRQGDVILPKEFMPDIQKGLKTKNNKLIDETVGKMMVKSKAAALRKLPYSNQADDSSVDNKLNELVNARYGANVENSNKMKKGYYNFGGMVPQNRNPYMKKPMGFENPMMAKQGISQMQSPQQSPQQIPNQIPAQSFENGGVSGYGDPPPKVVYPDYDLNQVDNTGVQNTQLPMYFWKEETENRQNYKKRINNEAWDKESRRLLQDQQNLVDEKIKLDRQLEILKSKNKRPWQSTFESIGGYRYGGKVPQYATGGQAGQWPPPGNIPAWKGGGLDYSSQQLLPSLKKPDYQNWNNEEDMWKQWESEEPQTFDYDRGQSYDYNRGKTWEHPDRKKRGRRGITKDMLMPKGEKPKVYKDDPNFKWFPIINEPPHKETQEQNKMRREAYGYLKEANENDKPKQKTYKLRYGGQIPQYATGGMTTNFTDPPPYTKSQRDQLKKWNKEYGKTGYPSYLFNSSDPRYSFINKSTQAFMAERNRRYMESGEYVKPIEDYTLEDTSAYNPMPTDPAAKRDYLNTFNVYDIRSGHGSPRGSEFRKKKPVEYKPVYQGRVPTIGRVSPGGKIE